LVAPIELNPDAPSRLLFVVDDITQRMKAQEDLDNQRILMETILSQAGDAILVCGQDGKVLFVNDAARRIGRIPDEVPITEVTPALWGTAYTPGGEEIPFSDWSIPRALRGEVYLSREARMVRADGSYYDILISFAPVRNSAGQIIAAVATFSDITQRKVEEEERRKLEAQIQHSQKLESLGVLAGGIAHDFNNLLVGILGNADLALSELSPSAPSRGYILDLIKAAQRASDLSKQMLAYSGKGKFTVEPLDINEIIREMAHLLEVSISKKAVLRYNLMDALPLVEADATQMRQIVMNLITNASDALGDSNGVISITTDAKHFTQSDFRGFYLDSTLPEGPYVALEISDSGCGMDPDTLSRIFEPFFTTKFTGRGLGLAAVLGIVRGHRGTLKVYSEPHRGTAFKVFLPVSAQAALPSLKSDYGAGEWRGTGLVLLVDDEDMVRRVTARMLNRLGFDVAVASDGQEAVDVFAKRSQEIVCVLLDLTMPRMDGETAYSTLRRMRADVPVILTSGYNEQEVRERFAGRGMAGFVQKPFKMEELHAALRRVLAHGNPAGPQVPVAE
ncbi:MAG: response regulator, partial [Candidatus Hydrogenedentes bacterium]|nr:response regulator [Candidatus Hydrogenedentota bacterium]